MDVRATVYFLVFLFPICVLARGSEIKGGFILLAKGHLLKKSLIKETKADSVMYCSQRCLIEGPHCKSINYGVSSLAKGKCQLNNNSAIACNEANLIGDKDFNYYERDTGEPSSCAPPPQKPKQLKMKNCAELYSNGTKLDGIYRIDPDGQGPFDVRCDMSASTGGWTVFQRRFDGSQDFYRGWTDYKTGFGDLNGEFWLGLDKIHRLSKADQNVLRVDLQDFNNEVRHAEYSVFMVANETDKYKLTVGDYSGDAVDSLSYHNGMSFTTKDADNDLYATSCAVHSFGAWWYNSCYDSSLNGKYLGSGDDSHQGIRWNKWHLDSMKKTEMKIRHPLA